MKINGITTATKNQNAGGVRWFLINNCIPKSGQQDIEVTILPQMNSDGLKHMEFIGNDKSFELEVERTSWKNGSLSEPRVIYKHELPEGDYSQKKIYRTKSIFKAEVPYQLIDWKNGKDLKKIDSVMLAEDVLKLYGKIKSHYENQQGEDYIRLVEKGMFNIAQGGYLKPNEYETLKKDE